MKIPTEHLKTFVWSYVFAKSMRENDTKQTHITHRLETATHEADIAVSNTKTVEKWLQVMRQEDESGN